MTVGEWLKRWLAQEAKASVRPRTFEAYRANVEHHLVPALGHIRLRKLTPVDVSHYLQAKVDSGLSPQTVRNQHIALRRSLEIATRYGYVGRNVARLVSSPRTEQTEVHPLTRDEARQLLAAAIGHPMEALIVLAASTGMRRSELLGLTWDRVDLDAGFLRVERTLARYDRAFHLDPPKTRQSRRTIALPPQVMKVLCAHRPRQDADQKAAIIWGNEWDLVFCDQWGRPFHGKAIHDQLLALLEKAKVRRVRFHDLRHGAATFLLAQGVPMKVVQDILGHSQMSMTADLYSHVVPELRQDAADRIGDVLFGSLAT